jgi:hypothetical protein
MVTYPPLSTARRRRWPWVVVVLAVLFVGLWVVAWNYAAAKVDSTIAGWREREAKVGRIYACATQTIGGFPFNINVECSDPSAEFRSAQTPAVLKWKDLHVTANVFSPTRLVARLTGPMTVGRPDGLPDVQANWKQATITMIGLPTAPERVTLAVEETRVERVAGGGNETVFTAQSAELVGRMVEGSAMNNPVIEVTLRTKAATAPRLHPAAATPIDSDVTLILRGLNNFAPKTWPERFREIQVANGRLDVTNARLQQGEVIAVTAGSLALTPRGRLNGELRTTVVNFEKLLPALGIERFMEQATAQGGQLGNAISALDRLVPGLGGVARQNAAPAMVAGIGLIGQPAELEGKRAVMMPLRFNDGNATLGPVPLGPTPSLF